MSRLRKARNCFTGQAEIDEVEFLARTLQPQIRLQILNPLPGVSNTVTEKHHATAAEQFARRASGWRKPRGRHQADLTNVHHRAGFLALRFDSESMSAGGKFHTAQLPREED